MLQINLHRVALEKEHCFGGRHTEYKYRANELLCATGQQSRACSLKCPVASLIPRAVHDCRSFKCIPKIQEKRELLFVTTTDTIYFEIIKNVPCRDGWLRES